MRFLLEFVPCCRSQESRRRVPERAAAAPRTEETRSLVKRTQDKRRKRGRGASGEWKPTLSAISEDTATMMAKGRKSGNGRGQSDERMVKRKSGGDGSRSRSRSRVPSYTEDYGRGGFATVIPAFSPTPFMI